MAETVKKWYVLRAISGKEGKVKEYLESEMKNTTLGAYVFQVLIPTEKVVSQRNGKKISKERNYLPGYVLVEAVLNGETMHFLSNTPNVIGFLGGKQNEPEPLRQSEVNRILGYADERQELEDDLIIYNVGDAVKVSYGPMSGFSGVVEEVNGEKKRLKVMVKIFGRKTPIELAFSQVEKE